MKRMRVVLAILFAAVVVWGCGSETSTEKVTDSSDIKSDTQKDVADSVMAAANKQADKMAETASEIADATLQKAQQLIDQAVQYINDGRLDLAGEVITQLETIEDSLPESIKSQIENLKSLFVAKESTEEAAKTVEAAQGLLPGQTK